MVPERDLRVNDPYRWFEMCVSSGQDPRLSHWAHTGPAGMLGSLVGWDTSDAAGYML